MKQTTGQCPVSRCPHCFSSDIGAGWQSMENVVTFRRNGVFGNRIKYTICRQCGAILHQVVAEPWKYPPVK